MRRTILLLSAATVAVAIGCYTGNGVDADANPASPTSSKDPTEPDGDDDGASKVAPEATGLPCDVAAILATSCTRCHGDPVRNGAPNSLVSYDDLAAESDDEPGKPIAELALERMKATQGTMPPSGSLPAAQVAVFEAWVESGMPRGSCDDSPDVDAGSDAGTDGGKPSDAAAEVVCSSAKYWEAGTPPGETMHPGKRCIACHSATGGPSFQFAGTVFKTLHEPDDCNGLAKNVSVLVIDAEGVSHTLAVNEAGNFKRVSAMPMPYRAMVVSGSSIHEMKTPQTDGDCNGCHTEQGKNGAPGRITAP